MITDVPRSAVGGIGGAGGSAQWVSDGRLPQSPAAQGSICPPINCGQSWEDPHCQGSVV